MTLPDPAELESLPEVDTSIPNAARMYDYHLGGSHNFAADRAAADRLLEVMPWAKDAVRANRNFLGRAVRYCQEQGIDQFLDLGSGIPTVGNVHEIAQATNPEARIAYVDNEPVTVVSSAALLANTPLCTITPADIRDPDAVFDAPGVRDLLDFTRPVGLLSVAVLHFLIDDAEVHALVRDYRSRLVAGSFHVLTHVTSDFDPDAAAGATEVYRKSANPAKTRTVAEITALLDGTEIVSPGIVDSSRWRPIELTGPEHVGFVAGVGRIG